jgi:succinoglycan biosynthesis transport protein ExoP
MTAPSVTGDPLQPESTDFRDYLRPIWAHKILILVLVVVATVGAYKYYDGKPRLYTTSTQVFVGDETGVSAAVQGADRTLANQARLVQTGTVAARVARKIGFKGDPRILLGYVTVTPADSADFIAVTSTGGNPQLVATLANAFAQAFIEMRYSAKRDQLRTQLDALKTQLAQATSPTEGPLRRSLQSRINQLQVDMSVQAKDARQLDSALPPRAPIAPNPKRNAIFAFALSLLLGIIAAFALERIDRRLRSADEAGRAYKLPIIATIKHEQEIHSQKDGRATVSDGVRESFRSLRSNIDLAASRYPVKTILITSAVPEEGKSSVVRNLALVYAEAGLRVAVIEADLRRPTLARSFGSRTEPGLSDVLMGLQPLEVVLQKVDAHAPSQILAGDANGNGASGAAAVAVLSTADGHGNPTTGSGLNLIASGPRPADPPAMFSAPSMAALLEKVAADHDIVIIDSPPLLAVSDAMPLLGLVDGTVLVSRVGTTTVDGAERVLTLTSRVPNVRVLGLVVNDVEGTFGDRYPAY